MHARTLVVRSGATLIVGPFEPISGDADSGDNILFDRAISAFFLLKGCTYTTLFDTESESKTDREIFLSAARKHDDIPNSAPFY
jgi:hypothetical protein